MPLAPRGPNTVYLGGPPGPGGGNFVIDNEHVVTGTPTPGFLMQYYDDAGVGKWRAHNTSAGTFAQKAFLLERPEFNQGIEDEYAANELGLVGIMPPGSLIYAIVPSGQNIVNGDPLESNGDGKLKEGTTAPVARAAETIGAVTADTRVRVEVL